MITRTISHFHAQGIRVIRARGSFQKVVCLTVCCLPLEIGDMDKLAVAQTVPAFGRVDAIEALVAKRVETILSVATKRPHGNDTVFTWTSQPGMIRSFGASPKFTQAFPLSIQARLRCFRIQSSLLSRCSLSRNGKNVLTNSPISMSRSTDAFLSSIQQLR